MSCRMFWPKSRFSNVLSCRKFSSIFTEIEIFDIFLTEIEIFRKLSPKSRFSKFFTGIVIFQKFWPKSRFSIFLTEIEKFWKWWPKSIILEFLTEIEIFRTFWPKSRFFEIFDRNRYFSKIYKEKSIFFFEKFAEINFSDQNRFFFINFNQDRDFQIFWPESKFF